MIKEVRLLYAPFRHFVSGHVCLVFKLVDGKEIVISPEARSDKFIPLLGFLPFYSLRYSKLEYDEYITKYQRAKRIFYSKTLALDPEAMLILYEKMNQRASYLEENKEMYHILSNSCITNTLRNIENSTNLNLSLVQRVVLIFIPHHLTNIIDAYNSNQIPNLVCGTENL